MFFFGKAGFGGDVREWVVFNHVDVFKTNRIFTESHHVGGVCMG